MYPLGRFAVVLLVVTAISAAAVPPVLADGATAPASVSVGPASQTPDVQFAVANNTTQHENPDEVDEGGDLLDVSRWLQGAMANRLQRSAIQLSQAQYRAARRIIGDEYTDRLGQFVDVAGETETDADDQTTDEFQTAHEKQRELAETVNDHRETVREYREAQQNGDTVRARRLARELQTITDRAHRTAAELVRLYVTISNRTGVDMREGIRSIRTVRENITAQQQEIRRDLFVATRLRVTAIDTSVSFRDPLQIRGFLRAANGTQLANRQITLVIADRTIQAQTNATGGFRTQFRPTTIPIGQQSVEVRYRPRNESIYLGSARNVTITVSQVSGELEVNERPQTVSFGDPVSVAGTATAAGIEAPGVPVLVSIGDVQLGTALTDTTGAFTIRTPLPAAVPNGTRMVRASVPLTGRALAVTDATGDVNVELTPTNLSLTAENGTGSIPVSGTLTTENGTPVTDQPITLRVDQRQVATAQTTTGGAFQTTIDGSNTTENVSIVATFQERETNLGSSRAVASAWKVPADSSTNPSNSDDSGPLGSALQTAIQSVSSLVSTSQSVSPWSPFFWIFAGAVSLLGTGVTVLLWGLILARRRGTHRNERTSDTETSASSSSNISEDGPDDGSDEPAEEEAPPNPAVAAEEYLDAGDYDAAVEVAYAGVRSVIADRFGIDNVATHWEFLADFEAQSEDAAAFRGLTMAYEQATFAPTPVDRETAESAVDTATEIGT